MTESVLRVIVEPAVAPQVRAMGYLNAARFAIAGWQNAHRQIYGALKRQLPAESARVPLYSNTRGST